MTTETTSIPKWYTDTELFSLLGNEYNDCLILTDSLYYLNNYSDDELQDNVEFEWTAESFLVGNPHVLWNNVAHDTTQWLNSQGYDARVLKAAHYYRGEGQYFIVGDLTKQHKLQYTSLHTTPHDIDERIKEKEKLNY